MLTIGEKLDNYVKRYGGMLTAAKIGEPMVRVLYRKRAMWEAVKLLDYISSDSPQYGYAIEARNEARAVYESELMRFPRARYLLALLDAPYIGERKVTHEMEAVV